jgi:hypothetical protein
MSLAATLDPAQEEQLRAIVDDLIAHDRRIDDALTRDRLDPEAVAGGAMDLLREGAFDVRARLADLADATAEAALLRGLRRAVPRRLRRRPRPHEYREKPWRAA